MKGQNKQSQREAARARKSIKDGEARKYKSAKSNAEILDIIANYTDLTVEEKRGGISAHYEGLNDKEKIKFLIGQIEQQDRMRIKYFKLLRALAGVEPQVSVMPRIESKHVIGILAHFRDIGFERITYIMLKHAICELIQNERQDGYRYNFTTSMTQVKKFLEQIGVKAGPRCYVSVGDEGELLKNYTWLDVGPIELFGGCANGEQRTHWIECNTGMLHPDYDK